MNATMEDPIGRVPPGGDGPGGQREDALVALVVGQWPKVEQDIGGLAGLRALLPDVYSARNRQIIEAAVAALEDDRTPDVATVGTRVRPDLAADVDALATKALDILPTNVGEFIDSVHRCARLRELEPMFRGVTEDVSKGVNPTGAIEELRACIDRLEVGGKGRARVHPRTRRLCDVEEVEREWLVPGLIPFGELTLLAGKGGCGKSTFLRALAAGCSVGAPLPMPGGGMTPRRDPMRVLILSREESVEMAIKPSIKLLGGDLRAIEVLDGEGLTDPPRVVGIRDIDVIAAAVRRSGARVLVCDSLERLCDCSPNKTEEIGPVLQSLSSWAQREQVAVLLLHHVNKGLSSDPAQRISGSTAIVNIPRHVLVMGAVPNGPKTQRALVVSKSNCAKLETGIVLDTREVGDLIAVDWIGPSTASSRDLLREDDEKRAPRARDEAGAAVQGFLTERGPVPSSVLMAWGETEGFSEATIRRAKTSVGCWSKRRGAPGGGRGAGEWWVGLPGQELPLESPEHLDHLEATTDGHGSNQGAQGEHLDPVPRR